MYWWWTRYCYFTRKLLKMIFTIYIYIYENNILYLKFIHVIYFLIYTSQIVIYDQIYLRRYHTNFPKIHDFTKSTKKNLNLKSNN